MSLPNRSHSVTEMATLNGHKHPHHHPQQSGLMHSNSANNHPLLYQRSFSYIKTINENQFQPTINDDPLFQTDKYNNNRTSSTLTRPHSSTTNGHTVYPTNSISQIEPDDIYRVQRLYHYDDDDKYKNHFSITKNTAKYIAPNLNQIPTLEKNGLSSNSINEKSNRRPLIAPKLRVINTNERLSSSDSGGSLQHSLKKHINEKSITINPDKNISRNGFSTWNRPSSSSSSRPTILPTYSNGFETQTNSNDPSYRIMRCTSMDTVRRQEQMPLMNSNEPLRTDSLLKQKMCSSKKHNHIPINNEFTSDNLRSQSFSMATIDSNQSILNNRHQYQNGDFNLQKPRVYTHDDRSFLPGGGQQQANILSSSSASSTLSVKDKINKDNLENRSYSTQEACNVIGGARGIVDYYGGKLSCPITGVSICVPIGAIPEGIQQEIYFQVCQDGSNIPTFNAKQGERLLSPIVMCGPHGVQFLKPIELILPHHAGTDAEQLALMLHGANQNGSLNNHQDKPTVLNGINHITNSNVSILVDHF